MPQISWYWRISYSSDQQNPCRGNRIKNVFHPIVLSMEYFRESFDKSLYFVRLCWCQPSILLPKFSHGNVTWICTVEILEDSLNLICSPRTWASSPWQRFYNLSYPNVPRYLFILDSKEAPTINSVLNKWDDIKCCLENHSIMIFPFLEEDARWIHVTSQGKTAEQQAMIHGCYGTNGYDWEEVTTAIQ